MILYLQQKRQAIMGLHCALHLFESTFNTLYSAFRLGTSIATCCANTVLVFVRFALNMPILLLQVGNNRERGVGLCALGRYNKSMPRLDVDSGRSCLYIWIGISKPLWERDKSWSKALTLSGQRGLALNRINPACLIWDRVNYVCTERLRDIGSKSY